MLSVKDDSRKWWVLAAMGGVIGVILLDETVVGVALPTIRRDLGMSGIASHWVVNAYLLVFAGFAAAGGRFGDVIGLKTLFIAGVAIFGVASVVAGFAENGVWLIATRAVQGIGAAIIFPASLAMVTIVFPEEQRGMAIGLCGSIGTVFLALGPLVGGLLTEFVSWRWIFWINPFLAVLIALIVKTAWLDPPKQEPAPRIDWTGLILLLCGLSMLVFAIMQGPDWGWSQPAIQIPLIVGILILIAFVLIERRNREPLIEVDLFRNATFTACNLVIFMGQFQKMAIIIFGSLYLQHELHMSPLWAGLALLPTVAPTPIMAIVAGRSADRFESRWPSLGGLIVTGLALLWTGIAFAWARYDLLLPGLLVWGLASAFIFAPPQRAVMNAVPTEKQGQAGGIAMTAQLMGGTIGMAICSTLFSTSSDYRLVYFAAAGVTFAVLVLGWFTIERNIRPPG